MRLALEREISSCPVFLFVVGAREPRVLGKLSQDKRTREPRVPTIRTIISFPFLRPKEKGRPELIRCWGRKGNTLIFPLAGRKIHYLRSSQ